MTVSELSGEETTDHYDSKGRRTSFIWYVKQRECKYVNDEFLKNRGLPLAGIIFELNIQKCKDGRCFGAHQSSTFYATRDEAEVYRDYSIAQRVKRLW